MNRKVLASEGIAPESNAIAANQVPAHMQISATCQFPGRIHAPAHLHVASHVHSTTGAKMSLDSNIAPDIHFPPNANSPSCPDRAPNSQYGFYVNIATHLDRACVDKGVGINAVDNQHLICRAELVHQPASIASTTIGDQLVE